LAISGFAVLCQHAKLRVDLDNCSAEMRELLIRRVVTRQSFLQDHGDPRHIEGNSIRDVWLSRFGGDTQGWLTEFWHIADTPAFSSFGDHSSSPIGS
jgi:hypothetical protein